MFDKGKNKFIRHDVMRVDNSVMSFVNYGGAIIESFNGGLYATSQSFGLLKYDYEAELFVEVPLKNNGNQKIVMSRYYDIEADEYNNLWLALHTGLIKVDLNNLEVHDVTPFKKIKAQNIFLDNAVSGLIIDKDKNMWVGTGRNGIYLYDFALENFTQVNLPSSSLFYSAFMEDNSGILWFGFSRGVMKYDSNRKPFVTYTLSEDNEENRKEIYSFSKSYVNKNKVWLTTAKGLFQYDDKLNTFKIASEIDKKLSYFDELGVYTALETSEGLLWIASLTDGLFSYSLKSGKLNNYKYEEYDNSTISHNIVHNLAIDNNSNLWVATHEGLNYLADGVTKFKLIPSFLNRTYDNDLFLRLKSFRENKNPTSSIIKVGDYADLTKEFVIREDANVIIYSVGEGLPAWGMVDYGWLESDNGDTLWTGGEFRNSFHASGGMKNRIKIGTLSLKAGRYKLRYKSDDSHSTVSYNDAPPQDSAYWGAQIFSLNNDEFISLNKLVEKSENNTFLEGEDIKIIFFDSNNETWIGTDDGLSFIDSNMVVKNFTQTSSKNNSLSNNFVRDIKEDLLGNIWIATADGLNKFDRKKNTFTVIRENEGLPSSNIASIQIDNEGDLWVSGVKGISKIELNEKGEVQIVVNYDVKDGLQGYEFIQSSSYKDENGKLYFGGVDGFNAFYPGSSNRTPPFISIQDIKVSNKHISELDEVETADLNLIDNLSFTHDQNDLSFEFASIHFSRPDKNRVMYKMDGVDEEWQVGDRRFASYTNLSPGSYTFHIKGSNGDGIWNENIRSIAIRISPPWYNNWTAYSIYGFVLLGLLFSVRKFEMRRQQKNTQIKESRLRIEAAEAKAEVAETKALIVQAENERKTKELEEARDLQLSMLPRNLPQLPNLDIAVYMKTATEVGGDYYDFHI
ncbi:MAG: triple tyrosine motif-containing protein, partial [Melioribacteraceae bacterium]|nr:triple tyrosine motif-containing protein [Melioribacteraceae bacterium]